VDVAISPDGSKIAYTFVSYSCPVGASCGARYATGYTAADHLTPPEQLLAVFELEKAVYELRYELNNRPDWVAIPVAGIVRLLDAD
jgi:predicted trehalose synthase